ncbi:MAG TPA: type IV-A pilus assembly ATPase PilB, partial [Candidatus Binatia bacterium]|nr:type IV-A pilus assembly ATPase PilB [Candidatus Binatia bacterium]
MSTRLGELLVRKGYITPEQLRKAIEVQRLHGGPLNEHLVKLGCFTEDVLLAYLQREYRLPAADPASLDIPNEVLQLVPHALVTKYHLLPIAQNGSSLTLAMADPSNLAAVDEIKFLTGADVKVTLATLSSVRRATERLYDRAMKYDHVLNDLRGQDVEVVKDQGEIDLQELERATEDAPVVRLVNAVFTDALRKRASDIHIEPYEQTFRVRFRIDGVLSEILQPPLTLKAAVASRIKVMASLDIAERRLPQDGRIKIKMGPNDAIDIRVSVLPTLFGEKIVMRLLDKSQLQTDMLKLGFEERALKDFKEGIYRPYGMVLVTGPTGSGKTTTLYSALSELNKITTNISTAEDPVEFNLPGINQVQVNEDIGLTFAAALRAFLRQDPDIIMVGEIRDRETAEIGVKAALTGHLVLSTVHTNDAPSTINRLLNMGVAPFLVASSVNLIVAQRLARRICPRCKVDQPITPQALIDLGIPPEEAKTYECKHGLGCPECGGSGYRGRIALYEVMPLYEEIRDLVLSSAPTPEIKRAAMNRGVKTLRQSGLTKVREGVTSLEEVMR